MLLKLGQTFRYFTKLRNNIMIYDVLVVGAGQAGLATAYSLQQQGLNFRILEAGE